MKQVIYIMGVAGSGKTTVGTLLHHKTGIPFFDADDFHPQHNKDKMKSGHALDDEDRAAWLQEMNILARQQTLLNGAIIACSALKEKYRSVLSNGITKSVWIFLQGSYGTIVERMENRTVHFMPASLLPSQFESLEIPAYALCITIEKEPGEIVEIIYDYLKSGPLKK